MRKKIFYCFAFIIPILVFFITASCNNFYPFGDRLLNIYDAKMQYPGLFMLLKDFSNFSFTGGLGFNVLGTATYYLFSPLNILFNFFSNENFHIFYTLIIYLKIGLCGLFMYTYLIKQEKSNNYSSLILAVAYALCGFVSTYYYNIMWLDGVYMLPLVLIGINKLIKENKKLFYIITLALSIVFNFYIGYMLCIFSAIYFIFKMIFEKNIDWKKNSIRFFISSLLAGLISAFVLVISFYALSQGKINGYSNGFTNYFELNQNIKSFFYTLTPGSYNLNGQSFGPAMIYCSLLSFVAFLLFFINDKFNKRQKLLVLSIFAFYFICFSFNLFDYAWQFFQKPVWWQSRYSFTFSAFIIMIAHYSLNNLDGLKNAIKPKIFLFVITAALVISSFILQYDRMDEYRLLSIIFLAFSIFLLLDYFFLVGNEKNNRLILIFFVIEIFINCFNSHKMNPNMESLEYYLLNQSIRFKAVEDIKKLDDSFYRMEFVSKYSSNDGMYYNYNGISYFNSARNIRFPLFAEKVGMKVDSDCGVIFQNLNPYLLSFLNVKYLLQYELPYYKKVVENASYSGYINPYPLSIGFMVNEKIYDLKLTDTPYENIYNLANYMVNEDLEIFKSVTGTYTADQDYFFVFKNDPLTSASIKDQDINEFDFNYLKKGDSITSSTYIQLFSVNDYETIMKELSKNILNVKNSNNLLEGTINVTEDKTTLFLSITYDESLIVKVDGKKVPIKEIANSFVGIDLTEGEHKIVINYETPGLKFGIIISVIGILGTTIYIYIEKRKKNEI